MSLTVTHKFVSAKSDSGDTTLVNPSNWNAIHTVTNLPILFASDYNFTPQQPGGSLIAGANVITLTPVPLGVNGTDVGHYLRISGGVGAQEDVLISGGTAVSGATSGTIIVTCANSHSGAWQISSATQGVVEASLVAPSVNAIVVADVPIDMSVLNTNITGFYKNVGNYPNDAYFGDATTSVPSAIRGAINIPANATTGAHGTGVEGYAISASANKGSVGVFGFGGCNASNVSTFGGNFLATNTRQPQSGTKTGNDFSIMYGIEVDLNLCKKSDGTTPTSQARGIYINGASECKGTAYAIDIGAFGFNQTPIIGFDAALHTNDASCTTCAIDLAAVGTGNTVASQNITLRSRDSGGVNRASYIFADPNGDIVLRPGNGSSILLEDSSANVCAIVSPNGSTPFFSVHNALQIPSAPPATSSSVGIAGQITYDANYIYICTTTNTWKRTALATF